MRSESIGLLCFSLFFTFFFLFFFSSIFSSSPSIASTRQTVDVSSMKIFVLLSFFSSDRRVLFALFSSSSLLLHGYSVYKSPFFSFSDLKMHVCLQCRGITKAREKKKEREMRIDILFFYSITCMHNTTIRTH